MKKTICGAVLLTFSMSMLTGCFSYENIGTSEVSEATTTAGTTVSETTTENSSETSADSYEFKQGLSSVKAYRVDSEGSEEVMYAEEYDENGNIVKLTGYKNGKIDNTDQRAYDEAGNIQRRQIETSGFFIGVTTYNYEYDESGKLLKEAYSGSFDCSDTTQPSYTSEGYVEYTYDGDLLIKISETRTDYEADVYTTTSHEDYEYNEDGLKIKASIYSSGTNTEENLDRIVTYEYDGNGVLISEKEFAPNQEEPSSETTYDYDEDGNLIKSTREVFGTSSLISTVTSEYDENGHKIKDTFKSEGEGYSIEYRD